MRAHSSSSLARLCKTYLAGRAAPGGCASRQQHGLHAWEACHAAGSTELVVGYAHTRPTAILSTWSTASLLAPFATACGSVFRAANTQAVSRSSSSPALAHSHKPHPRSAMISSRLLLKPASTRACLRLSTWLASALGHWMQSLTHQLARSAQALQQQHRLRARP